MSASALHQGTSLGVYPQRQETTTDSIERIGTDLLGRVTEKITWRKNQLQRVVAEVNKTKARLAAYSDEALQHQREEIRYQLVRGGLQEKHVLRCFAVIREYATRTLQMQYYDVQLFGAWVIVNGNLAEMATGEGKSFTASLAAATAALAGIPVHIVTSNEYLAQRDAQEMQPLYEALGLTVSTVLEEMDHAEKRDAYSCDIVYCTNKQVAFDYLRDRLALRNETGRIALKFGDAYKEGKLVLRGLCFAIIDEADSVLIDEARTPLILSREHSDDGQEKIYREALAFASKMEAPLHYRLNKREHRLKLTKAGQRWLTEQTEDMTGLWAGARHSRFLVHQALCALHLFTRDVHYLVRDDAVAIIDANTGRTMADRSWQKGLQQIIECKEDCTLTGQRETLANISYQRFFRRYLHMGGMSGTLTQVHSELRSVYQQHVIPVPTHRPCQRENQHIAMHLKAPDKWMAVFAKIIAINATGQPVLIGAGSVRDSELLSAFLTRRKLDHTVLNARQDQQEADVIARAGERGQITVATNMAGRGTDIKLGAGVAELGGLHVITTYCHEERRVDRQLIGRCARQGDPGSSETHVALDDSLLKNFYTPRLHQWLNRWIEQGHTFPQWLVTALVRLPQLTISRQHRLERIDVMHLHEKLGKVLAYSGRPE